MCVVAAYVSVRLGPCFNNKKKQNITNWGFRELTGHVIFFFLTSLCCRIWQFRFVSRPSCCRFSFVFLYGGGDMFNFCTRIRALAFPDSI